MADELPEPLNDDEMSEVFDLEALEKAEEAMEKWKWVSISSENILSNTKEIFGA